MNVYKLYKSEYVFRILKYFVLELLTKILKLTLIHKTYQKMGCLPRQKGQRHIEITD